MIFVRKIQRRGPYQFCGYSTFGLVAYEMARALLSEGEDVSFPTLFDIWHPRYRQRLSLTEAQYEFTRIVDRPGKYGRLLTQGKFDDVTSLVLELVSQDGKINVLADHPVYFSTDRLVRCQGRCK
jgi:thioesterase domain-containing protein